MNDRSRQFRVAFYTALVEDMVRNGMNAEEICRELERITGNPVEIDNSTDGPTFTLRDNYI